jgi:hypothetical protein
MALTTTPMAAILFQSNLNVKLTFAICENCGAQGELAREQIFWNYGRAEGKKNELLSGAFILGLEGPSSAL